MLHLCMLVVLLCHIESRESHLTETEQTYTPSTYLWDKLEFGKQWQVYIQVMTYDLLHASFYSKGSTKYGAPTSLLDVVTTLTTIVQDKHPCRISIGIMHGRQVDGKFFAQHTNYFNYFVTTVFRICGIFSFTYNPSHYNDVSDLVLSDFNNTDQIYPGIRKVKYVLIHLQAGDGYVVNCTITEFTAPRSHGCADTRVRVDLYDPKYLWYIMCPNWGKRNFVAAHIEVSLFMEYYQKALLSNIGGQRFTKLSLHYYILDISNLALKLNMIPMIPTRQRAKIGVEYMLGVYHYNMGTFILSNSSLLYIGNFPTVLVYSFTLYTDDFLTPVVSPANVTCNIPEAEIIFYDGPVQTFWQPVLPLLAHWRCSKISNRTTGNKENDEVRGSVGELNIILYIPSQKTHGSLFVVIAWHAERILPGALQIHKIVLDVSAVRTIHFRPERATSLEVAHVQAPKGKFVHLEFADISYILHSEMYPFRSTHCRDGFEMKNPMMPHASGRICSNTTAANVFNLYQNDGLTVDQEIILRKKQYAWLATISAVIIVRSHSCVGYINLLPRQNNIFLHYRAQWAVVAFSGGKRYFEDGGFVRYREFRVIFKRSPQACCKIQIVPFHDLELYEMELEKMYHMYTYIKYTIMSENFTSPTRFIIDLSSLGDILLFENTSSVHGIRLVSLNNRYIKPTLSHAGVWDTEAYSAEIGLHSSSLTHAAGFTVQVEDGMSPAVCTYERMTNITAMPLDLNLFGPCGNAEVNAHTVNAVLIHKINTKKSCCEFTGYITTLQSIDGLVELHMVRRDKYGLSLLNTYDLSGNNTVIKFQLLCIQFCSVILTYFKLDRISVHTVSIAYHVNPIWQDYPTGISFQNATFPVDLESTGSELVPWSQVCHNHHCYTTPRRHMNATWDEARKTCEDQQATLVSINSDLEWALLTQIPQQHGEEFIELYNMWGTHILYIGLLRDIQNHTHYNSFRWIDGSPYAFQNWDYPSEQTVYPGRYFEFYEQNAFLSKGLMQERQEREFVFFHPQIIQPQLAQENLCAAALIPRTQLPQWVMVPCDRAIPAASFVCESRRTDGKLRLRSKTIFRSNRECPSETINIGSSCLHVVNTLSRNEVNVEKICGRLSLSVFNLPTFLFRYNPQQKSHNIWGPNDYFLVTLLTSMAHRWYAFGQNSKFTDTLVGADQQSSEKSKHVGLRYYEDNLVHIHVVNLDSDLPSSGLNIVLCNHSMVVTNSSCPHGHAMCEDGTCILSHYVCDGRSDCPDNSDEHDCSHVCSFSDNVIGDLNCFNSCLSPHCVCNELYFSCELGGCVPWSRVCNRLPDCPNAEDEKLCSFITEESENYLLFVESNFAQKPPHRRKKGGYKCIHGPNISHALVDDLVPDCPEQDDERSYYAFLKNGSRPDFFSESFLCEQPDATTCEKNYKGVCYSRHLHCVHEVVISPTIEQMTSVKAETCRNGAHLRNCMMYSCPSFFKCPAAYCIPVYTVCNGQVDCPDGEDEENCQNISCPGFLLCRYDKVCVHPHDVWSGRVKCPVSMDDKALRDIGACPDHCHCLGNGVRCVEAPNLDLPKLPQSLRLLVIVNTRFTLDHLQWKGNVVAVLHLQVSYCNISSLEWRHFRPLQFLQTLILRNNIIPFLPSGVFQSLSVVKVIDLGHNLISELHPTIFQGISTVHLLKLDFNQITSIEPCTFKELGILIELHLSNNYLTTLGDNVFCHLLSIKELYIGGNRLENIDKRLFNSHMQYLVHLDTTPLQICCFVPQVPHCYPKEGFFFSTCKNLLGLSLRYAALVGGICLFSVSVCSVIWTCRRKRTYNPKSRGTNLSDMLNITLFLCDSLKAIHMIILAGVDFVFRDYYALHQQKWELHPLCIMLNMLSHTLVLVTVFLSLLISCTRMIACAFPFHLPSVSFRKVIWTTIIFISVTLSVSFLPYSGISRPHKNELQTALGFGLVLPVIIHKKHSLWSLLGYALPCTTMLFVSCAFHIMSIRALLKKPRELKHSMVKLKNRRGSTVRCIVTLVLSLSCQMPLLILHVAAASDVDFPPDISVAVTMFTLIFYSVVNAILYIAITPVFIELSLGCLRRIHVSVSSTFSSVMDNVIDG